MRRAVTILAALTFLAGCSESTTGSPSSGTSADQAPTTSESSSAAKQPANRPKTINVKDVDPCSLIAPAQRPEFGLDRPPQAGTVKDFGWPSCTFSREDRKYVVSTAVVTDAGIEFYTEGSRADGLKKLEVGGFPAVLIEPTQKIGSCTIAIDVSDGQRVEVSPLSFGDVDAAGLCPVSEQVAGAVVATLMSK